MRTTLITTMFLVLVSATASCDNKSDVTTAPSGTVSASAPAPSEHVGHAHAGHAHSGHAPAGAKPGSHEDWCSGHAVAESMCTRCNASLIPAFKATGDWCEEHGLPESQCLKCNPGLKIERPPKTAGK